MKQISKGWKAFVKLLGLMVVMLCLFASTASAASLRARLTTDAIYVHPGDTITLTAKARGGSHKYRYKFQAKHEYGKNVTVRKFKANPVAEFTPTAEGEYTITLLVKDSEGARKTVTARIRVKKPAPDNEMALRNMVVAAAWSYRRTREGSLKHKEIIDTYNSYSNNFYRTADYTFSSPRRYSHFTMDTSLSWCDAFVSAMFIKTGMDSISGVECGCPWHILWLQDHGSFVEADDYIPDPGDMIFYSWGDSGYGDCKGSAGHVGIVKSVGRDGTITTIEGNYDDRVKSRKIKIDGQFIRGYGVPKYSRLVGKIRVTPAANTAVNTGSNSNGGSNTGSTNGNASSNTNSNTGAKDYAEA